MSEKQPIDLEWLDMVSELVTHQRAQEIITEKNKGLLTNEAYWRLPIPREIWLVRNVFSKGIGLRDTKYMRRSSRTDGLIVAVDSNGKKFFVSPETCLHFFIVRSIRAK